MNILIGYERCSTCKAIEKQLKAKEIPYQFREITEDIPSAEELMAWFKLSGENSIKKLMNTSGTLYREKNYKEKLMGLSEMEQLKLVAENGMLIKRPILITDTNEVYIGKAVEEYITQL